MATHGVLLPTLAMNDEGVALIIGLAFLGVLIYAIYAIHDICKTRAKEHTKREVAAYVAEGSIRAEDAAVILNAGSDAVAETIADAVAWGTIKPEKADILLKTIRSDRARPAQPTPPSGVPDGAAAARA